jgi:hypothetical protein
VALAGVLNGVMQQAGDRLVFRAAVFPHQAAHGDQVGDVGDWLAFAPLIAVQLLGPHQGAAIGG